MLLSKLGIMNLQKCLSTNTMHMTNIISLPNNNQQTDLGIYQIKQLITDCRVKKALRN